MAPAACLLGGGFRPFLRLVRIVLTPPLPDLSPDTDRVMICGSMGLNTDLKTLLEARGFEEVANSEPGDCVIEKAFVG